MRDHWPLLLAFSLGALACGKSADTLSFANPMEAAEAGAAALAKGDAPVAIAAFEKAAEATEPQAKLQALTGLFKAQLAAAKDAEAIAAMNRMVAECKPLLAPESLNNLATAALNAKNAVVADAVVNKALELFPEAKEQFAKAVSAVDLLKTSGPGADLSSLGYTGN